MRGFGYFLEQYLTARDKFMQTNEQEDYVAMNYHLRNLNNFVERLSDG